MLAKGASDARGVSGVVEGVAEGQEMLTRKETKERRGEGEGEMLGWKPEHVPMIEDYRAVMLQRAVFQSVASMGLPAFTIHSIVRYSGKALKDSQNTRLRTYGPIGVSISLPSALCVCLDADADADVKYSSVSRQYRSCPSSLTSLSKKRRNGLSTRVSNPSGARKLYAIGRSRGE